MKTTCILLALWLLLAGGALAAPTAEPVLDEHLQPLAHLVNKTWRGTLDQPDGPPLVDVSRWEPTLGGKAIRIVHSLNQGEYGGETIIFWDAGLQSLAFYYFTTENFYTHGTLVATEGGFTSLEIVENNQDGITQVRAMVSVLPDGRLHNRSEYLKNGEWVAGHDLTYVEAPDAQVVFK